ncbi:hypothetical protein AAHN97_18890 [Chitinophaga niabensis]|uniref:hypothetical protein n=1 Tax=Chitinophaga niabensis TaxID=536979 RepID=UPI0031BA5ACF
MVFKARFLPEKKREETVDPPEDCFKNRELNMAIRFRLHTEHAMSYKQTTARMNTSMGTIGVHMNRALKTLKQHLSHLQGIA